MTNPIGNGTVNVSVNMVDEESAIWGKLTVAFNKSKGAILREMAVVGLASVDPELADEIKEIRKARAIQSGSAILLFLILFQLTTSFNAQILRANRRCGRSEKIRVVRNRYRGKTETIFEV